VRSVKVGLLGLGTVGGGTVNVLRRNAEVIEARAGCHIELVQASTRDLNKPRICETEGIALTTAPAEVVDNPEIDIILELMGGDTIAREMVLRAIANGKHVITANKALLAKHGNEIFAAAAKQGVMVAYEAAVAGGIPVIKALREGLAANQIEWLAGIINGTGNFILSEMRDDGREFTEVLAEAQRLGYAEADPTFDVEGIDAAHKLTLMASIAFGIPLHFDHVFTEGITHITREDVSLAEELGYRIRHLGIARRTWNGIELRVHPTLIPEKRLIANVDGVMNAVVIKGDAVGPTLYYGPGAGDEPTASAVIADLVDVARSMSAEPECRVPYLGFQPDAIHDSPIVPMEEVETSYYLRMQVVDRPGVLTEVTGILSDLDVSIEAIVQKEAVPGESLVNIIILTHKVVEKNMNQALQKLEDLDATFGSVTRIRMEALD
jgi:homoserine dehydrogenase